MVARNQVCNGIRKLVAAFGHRSSRRSEEQGVRLAAGNLFHAASDVRSSVSKDGLVLLHIGSGLIFTANRTGARIWSEIVQGTCPDVVGRGLSREYGLPIAQTTEEVAHFVSELVSQGLLVQNGS